MKKMVISCLMMLLLPTMASASVDLSNVAWKPWPVSAYKYRPSLGTRTLQVNAPPHTITGVSRWNGGRMIVVQGYNGRSMATITDIVSETDSYWTVNPRRLLVCGNPATGKCFNVMKPCPPPCPTVSKPPCEPTCPPLPPPCAIIGAVEGSPAMYARGESQYSPTTPRESVDNGGWSIPFGVFGYKPNQTTVVQEEKPVCEPIPGQPGGIPADPTVPATR